MNKEILVKLVRHLLGFAGGYFVAKGVEIDSTSLDAIAGGISAIIAIAWSLRAAKPVTAE